MSGRGNRRLNGWMNMICVRIEHILNPFHSTISLSPMQRAKTNYKAITTLNDSRGGYMHTYICNCGYNWESTGKPESCEGCLSSFKVAPLCAVASEGYTYASVHLASKALAEECDKVEEEKAEAHPVNSPSHYAGAYPFEVYKARALLLDTYCTEMKPSDLGLLNEELKYRLRAGLKQYDGLTIEESAQRDIAKAMRCRQMREEGW